MIDNIKKRLFGYSIFRLVVLIGILLKPSVGSAEENQNSLAGEPDAPGTPAGNAALGIVNSRPLTDDNFIALAAEADSAYQKGKYEEAVDLYRQLVEADGVSANLLYNLGNAYYKAGDEGEARLCLERAKRLDPSNEYISQNIRYLDSRIEDANKAEMKGKKGDVGRDPVGYFGRLHQSIAIDTSSDAWAEMAATSFILLILALAAYIFGQDVRLKKIGFFSGLIFLFFSVIFVIFAEMGASSFERKDEAVLMQFKTTLSAEPAANAQLIGFPLHKGTKFTILDTELDSEGKIGWYKVKLNSNNVGWVQADAVEII